MAIDTSDNIIDTRDVCSEADEYEDSIACKQEEIDMKESEIADLDDDDDELDDDRQTLDGELENLQSELEGLKEESEDIIEFRDDCQLYGGEVTLINEDYWVDYVQEYAREVCATDDSDWPFNCIDCDRAADELRIDYSTITFRGQDFYIRA